MPNVAAATYGPLFSPDFVNVSAIKASLFKS
jgi:hypothetical protein